MAVFKQFLIPVGHEFLEPVTEFFQGFGRTGLVVQVLQGYRPGDFRNVLICFNYLVHPAVKRPPEAKIIRMKLKGLALVNGFHHPGVQPETTGGQGRGSIFTTKYAPLGDKGKAGHHP